MNQYNLKILADINCNLFIDNQFITTIQKDEIQIISMEQGEYLVKCMYVNDPNTKIEKLVILEHHKVLKFDFQSLMSEVDNNLYFPNKCVVYEELVPCKYNTIIGINEGLVLVQRNGKWGFVDERGCEIIPCIYDLISDPEDGKLWDRGCMKFVDGLAKIKLGSKYGFIDRYGNTVSNMYDGVDIFSGGLSLVYNGTKYGYIDKKGYEIIPLQYDLSYVNRFNDGLARISHSEKSGYINIKGQEIIPCIYDSAIEFHDGLASVWKNGYCGVIDINGNVIIPFKYAGIGNFHEGLASFTPLHSKRYGYIDKCGNEVVPPKYDMVYDFYNGLAKVYKNGLWGVIDKLGNERAACKYWEYFSNNTELEESFKLNFTNGILHVMTLDKNHGIKKGAINSNGHEIIPCIYESVRSLCKGFEVVRMWGKEGIVDTSGNEILPCTYDRIDYLGIGLIGLCIAKKWGVADIRGNIVIPIIYDGAKRFCKGLVGLKTVNGRWEIVDVKGRSIIPPIFDDIEYLSDFLAIIKYENKWRVVDECGTEILPYMFNNASDVSMLNANTIKYRMSTGFGLLKLKITPSDKSSGHK